MLRPLISYADLAERHGRRPALKVLHQLEQLANIEPETVIPFAFVFSEAQTDVTVNNFQPTDVFTFSDYGQITRIAYQSINSSSGVLSAYVGSNQIANITINGSIQSFSASGNTIVDPPVALGTDGKPLSNNDPLVAIPNQFGSAATEAVTPPWDDSGRNALSSQGFDEPATNWQKLLQPPQAAEYYDNLTADFGVAQHSDWYAAYALLTPPMAATDSLVPFGSHTDTTSALLSDGSQTHADPSRSFFASAGSLFHKIFG